MAKVRIDASVCTGCLHCMEAGFAGDFVVGENGKPVYAIDDSECIDCGHCAAACPTGALTHTAFGPDTLGPITSPAHVGYPELMDLLRRRRSRREFRDTPVSREDIDRLLAAAAQAPAAMNRRTVRYAVVTDPVAIARMADRAATFMSRTAAMARNPIGRLLLHAMAGAGYGDIVTMLPKMERIAASHRPGHDAILFGAPCVILLHAPSGDTCGLVNACYHSSCMILAAESLDLGACMVGFVAEAAARDREILRVAGIPDGRVVHAVVALGRPKFPYPASIDRPVPGTE